jgi:hypothetical protein
VKWLKLSGGPGLGCDRYINAVGRTIKKLLLPFLLAVLD